MAEGLSAFGRVEGWVGALTSGGTPRGRPLEVSSDRVRPEAARTQESLVVR